MHIFKRRLKFPNEIWTLSVWYLENMYGQCNINDQYCMVASNDGAINSLHSKVMTLMYLLWVLLYGLSWLHVCNVLLLELKYFSHFCFYRISWTNNQNVLQGVSFEILLFQMAVALNWWDSDPKLVKPKCVWEAVVFCAKSNFFSKNLKNEKFHQKYIFRKSPEQDSI